MYRPLKFQLPTILLNFGKHLHQICVHRADLKPMQPHWAPRHGGRAGCLFLPDTPYARELQKRLINLLVSKLLSRLNERWISSNYYRTLSNMLNSHAELHICAPPRPTFYG